jgi:ABC-type bacteriocin/lantibiotic exporter with double-glycine peptidase domain
MFKKITIMMSKKQMRSLYFFIFLSFVTMILETAGIGLIIPFVQALITEGINQDLIEFLSIFSIQPTSKYNLIFILIAVLAFVYTFKVLFLTYFSYAQTKLLADLRIFLSDKLYRIYLNKPYSFHLNNNSSKLIRNIDEISLVVHVLKSLILLITEVVVFLGISTFVILYEPKGSLIVILFLGSFGYLFFRKVQIKAKGWGKTRQAHAGLRFKYLREGFRSIKDIKILQRSNELIKTFTTNNKILNLCEIKQTFIDSLPRLWLEWLVVVGFILLILSMLFLEKELLYIVPLLGLFAAAAFRIMPSLARIMNSIQTIIFYRPTVDSIYKEFDQESSQNDINEISPKKFFFTRDIDLKNINFKYSESGPFILRNINLNIKSGTTIGLIGESGIGKTTLINIILGLIQPTDGSIHADGINIFENIKNWQSQIGYVPQDIYLSDDTIRKNIAFGLPEEKIDDIAINKAVTNAKLDSLVNNLNDGINTKIGEFGDRISGGQRQRIAIARALYTNPKILILDECTNSLDLNTEKQIINEVNFLKGKKTIIMIAHRLSTLENCDHIYKIDKEGLRFQ